MIRRSSLVPNCAGLAALAAVLALLAGCAAAQKTVSPRLTNATTKLNAELRAEDTAQVWRTHFIDVGQGLAVLLEFPCGAALIDTGGELDARFDSNAALQGYLDAFFARRTDLKNTLELLLLTHPHVDHTRGVQTVLERYAVHNLVDNGQDFGSGADGQKFLQGWGRDHADVHYRAIRLADVVTATGLSDAVIDPLQCGGTDPVIAALWGQLAVDPGWPGMRFGKTPFQNSNNHSVVVRVAYGKATGLFTGDLEEPAIKDLLIRYGPAGVLDIDIYQVGHHGSINGTLPEFAAAMTPEVAVFSMGPHHWQLTWSAWKYGHPRREIVAMLADVITRRRKPIDVQVGIRGEHFEPQRIEAALYGTGWDGSVVVESRADGRQRVVTAGR